VSSFSRCASARQSDSGRYHALSQAKVRLTTGVIAGQSITDERCCGQRFSARQPVILFRRNIVTSTDDIKAWYVGILRDRLYGRSFAERCARHHKTTRNLRCWAFARRREWLTAHRVALRIRCFIKTRSLYAALRAGCCACCGGRRRNNARCCGMRCGKPFLLLLTLCHLAAAAAAGNARQKSAADVYRDGSVAAPRRYRIFSVCWCCYRV